jgi:hypothetical protein
MDHHDLRQLAHLGILRADDRGTFTRQDVMRARVVTHLHSMGIETEPLATALASGHLTLGYLESAGRRHPSSDRTFAEVAKEIGVPFTTLERIYKRQRTLSACVENADDVGVLEARQHLDLTLLACLIAGQLSLLPKNLDGD